jgi:hypothetical protein
MTNAFAVGMPLDSFISIKRTRLDRLEIISWFSKSAAWKGARNWRSLSDSAGDAKREEFLGDVISQWPYRASRATLKEQRLHDSQFRRAQSLLKDMTPIEEVILKEFGKDEVRRLRAIYRFNLQDGTKAISLLRRQSRSLPPQIANKVATQTLNELILPRQ